MDITELESFKMSDAIKFHDELNPNLWNGDHLDPEVRKQLLLIAEDFVTSLGIGKLNIKDISISGSNAAYSYTDNSDLDLHIVVDIGKLDNDEIYRELFNAKKIIYNDTHEISVHGVPVELYVQDSAEPHISLGDYSVMNDKWNKIPKKQRANFDQVATRQKYETLAQLIDLALKTRDEDRVNTLISKVKRYRQAGLDKGGEFSPENLAYKAVRSQGAIDALYDLRNKLHSEKMSIEESDFLNMRTPTVKELAKKHKKTTEYIEKQLKAGIKVEKEHTKMPKIAREIALDHLREDPDYYKKLSKLSLEESLVNEGGWTTGDNPGIKAKVVRHGIAAVERFLKDFNPWLKEQGLGPVNVGHPTGSAAYHEVDDPENTIYGDMDIQVVIPDLPEYDDMTSGQLQGRWGALINKFIQDSDLSYIDKSESKGSQPMFKLADGSKVQVDIMPHPAKTSEWGRFRATGEHGLKGLLNGNIFATMSELIPFNLQHKGIQYKTIDGKKVDYGKTLKNYKLHTVSTDIKRWILEIFLHEAKMYGIKKPKIDPLLKDNPGVDINSVNVERQVNGIKGFARSCELNKMFGKPGDLAGFVSAQDFLHKFITHYVDKSQHAIDAKKRDKASTPASVARAEKDREALRKGLEYVKKLFAGDVQGKRYKDYASSIKESSTQLDEAGGLPVYYFAYGMLTDPDKMPGANLVGVGELRNFEYKLYTYANVEPTAGSTVYGCLWEIDAKLLSRLDMIEGFPSLYDRRSYPVYCDGEKYAAEVYVMTPFTLKYMQGTTPSKSYVNTIAKGYQHAGVPLSQLNSAVQAAIKASDNSGHSRKGRFREENSKVNAQLEEASGYIPSAKGKNVGVAEGTEQLDVDYYMNEGCGIFAVTKALNSSNAKIYVISKNEGEAWSSNFPYELTHVFVYIPNQGTIDVKGNRTPEQMAKDFHLSKNDYRIKGPFSPKEFYSKFMGNTDAKPLYGTKQEINQLQKQLQVKQDVAEGASGYIPSNAQKNDPRFKTALTVDVRPDTMKKNAKAFGNKITRAGIPPQARADGKIAESLMQEWKSFIVPKTGD